MSRFNLIDEKWIPVRYPNGDRNELGIKGTLLNAGAIAAIEDPSPLVVAALHRFLLALLYRALEGPTDIDQSKALFKAGLPRDRITAYLEKWRDRFWLFDEKYPFGQNPHIAKSEIEPWTKLTAEYNATSNKVLFDHTNTRDLYPRNMKEYSRWLLSTMAFSIAGGRGYYPSPSPNAMMCIPLGQNLQKTLCYCLVPYPNKDVMGEDSALWEREPNILPLSIPKRASTGYADLYTWQSRMILLEELPSGEVTSMRFIAGHGFDNPSRNPDPMHPYKIDKVKGKLPIQFREDRGTWRDFDSLLPDSTQLAPLTVQNAITIAGRDAGSVPQSVMVLGLRYEPPSANVDFWRMERFVLPEALSGDRFIRSEIRQLLTDAEDAQKSLWLSCRSFARDMLSRGGREPVGKDIRGFVAQMPVNSRYWSSMESHFHTILHEYTLDRDPDSIRNHWLKAIRETLLGVWEQHRASVSMVDVWTIRALVKAEFPVMQKLKELNDEIRKMQPVEEDT
jgi:CRISPR system Cascade subunit CasA